MLNLGEYNATHKVCENYEDVLTCLTELDNEKVIAVDTETSGLNPYKDYICGFAFGKLPGVGYYIPVRHFNNPMDEKESKEVIKLVKDWLVNTPKIEKVFWNSKFDLKMLNRDQIAVSGVIHDGMVLLPLADRPTISEKLSLKSVAKEILKVEAKGMEALKQEKKGKDIEKYGYAGLDWKVVSFYACEDGIFTIKLWEYLTKLILD